MERFRETRHEAHDPRTRSRTEARPRIVNARVGPERFDRLDRFGCVRHGARDQASTNEISRVGSRRRTRSMSRPTRESGRWIERRPSRTRRWRSAPFTSTSISSFEIPGKSISSRVRPPARRIRKARQTMPNRPVYSPEERRRRKLVRRSHFMTIIAAWVITVPAAATMSGVIFLLLNTVMS